jgi:hypothetical protein
MESSDVRWYRLLIYVVPEIIWAHGLLMYEVGVVDNIWADTLAPSSRIKNNS